MALTPEDVVNKRFESTKFREGYDQDDVDDFLDEVVVELRRLNHENDELRQRLTAAESRSNELQQSANSAPAAPAPVAAAPQASAPAAIESAPTPAAPAPEPSSSALDDASSTNNLLQLARRLHEEHVRDGIAKRDALIAEGQASAAELVADAETQRRTQIGSLEHERDAIEARIESLQNFEREYREKLKSYIEEQLHELNSANLVSGAASTRQDDALKQGAPEPTSSEEDSSKSGQFEPAPHDSAPIAQPAGNLSPEPFAAPQPAQQQPSAGFTGFSGS